MPGNLTPLSISPPGYKGLNTEDATALLGPEWATEANNCVFDEAGRIAARKGWRKLHTTAISGSPAVKAVIEYNDGAGTKEIISAAGNAIYEGTTTLTDVSGTITTPTGDYWKFINFNSKLLGFQASHTPVVYSGSAFADLVPTYGAGAVPTTWSGIGLSAAGRVWTTDSTRTVIKYSALLDETDWDDAGSTAGYIDLQTVWKGGIDEVSALEVFNGQLVIFCKNSILIYSGIFDPSTMSLVENIWGMGCIAQNSVQVIGEDLWFLSSSGIRSLQRTIIQDKMPMSDISHNVRGYLSDHVTSASEQEINSTYNEEEGFYVLTIPSANRSFVFDVRGQLEGGAYRCTTWSDISPYAMHTSSDNTLYLGQAGYVSDYFGYDDNDSTYDLNFRSGWFSMATQQNGNRLNIPKTMRLLLYTGTTNTVRINWNFDFKLSDKTYIKSITGDVVSEYNVAEYNIAEYAGGGGLREIRVPMSGYGDIFRFGFFSTINNAELAFQKVDILTKLGRLN